jgi:hypothetical protein
MDKPCYRFNMWNHDLASNQRGSITVSENAFGNTYILCSAVIV